MKGIVYYIKSKHTTKVYVGSSTMTPEVRFQIHESNFRCKVGITSTEIMQYEDAYMEVIEELEDDDRDTLIARLIVIEAHHIKTVDCVNKNIPGGRTVEEWKIYHKEYSKIWAATPENKARCKIQRDIPANKEKRKTYESTLMYKANAKKCRDKPEAKALAKINNARPERRTQQYAWKSVSILCECGLHYTQGHKVRHLESKKHKDFMARMANL